MPAGRPGLADAGALYAFAHQFYWDFRRLAEGGSRWRFDKRKYEQLAGEPDKATLQLSEEQKARAEEIVEEEIQSGRLTEAERKNRLRDIEEGQLYATRVGLRFEAAEEARKQLRIPGEMDVLEALLDPKNTPERIREICKDAFVLRTVEIETGVFREVEVRNWPIATGSVLPSYLSQYAQEFVAALKDRRFPRCDVSRRPTNRLKQLWFLSRALAGALFGMKTRTAINLVGSKRPEQVFQESRGARPVRKPTTQKRRKKS